MAKYPWLPCKLKGKTSVGRLFDFLTNLGVRLQRQLKKQITFGCGVLKKFTKKIIFGPSDLKNSKDPMVFMKDLIKNQQFFRGVFEWVMIF